ncbi:MAG TPA: GNAT family N-acetyltransferase [Jatrophihabitantaceae bacterium]
MLIERDDGLAISDDMARLDVDRVHAWLRASYWASDRDRPTLEAAIAGSVNFGVYAPAGEQVAFARVVTDQATFAWICDVVVDEAWRGKGVGTWLMRAVVDAITAHGVGRTMLATRDAHGVYERVGFRAPRNPEFWMEIDRRRSRPRPLDEVTDPG